MKCQSLLSEKKKKKKGKKIKCLLKFLLSMLGINNYHTKGRFSRGKTGDIFLIFPRKKDLSLHANCLLRRQFA